ncbi:MAG: NTP transferase domain-containing protein [Phycisphaerae bacterium]
MTLSAIILAAGKATRMKSERVKVLHEICGRPMLAYVLDACRAVGVTRLFVVVGHDKERVMETFQGDKDITWVVQTEQKGTGHACLVCQESFAKAGLLAGAGDDAAQCFVLCGDGPLIRAETLTQLLGRHREDRATITLATCELPDPTGYGRIVRAGGGKEGAVLGIVEQSDATPDQRALREVNPSYYLYQPAELFNLLAQVKPNNKKGEYYITDTLQLALAAGQKVSALCAVPPEDVLSINSRADLAQVNQVMQERIQKEIMGSGVTLVSPAQTWIEFGAKIGQDTILEPFTWVGQGAAIGPQMRIKAGTVIPAGTRVT